jgi:hypothetical protein
MNDAAFGIDNEFHENTRILREYSLEGRERMSLNEYVRVPFFWDLKSCCIVPHPSLKPFYNPLLLE